MAKRIVSLVLALVITLTLVACGGNNNPSASTDGTTTPENGALTGNRQDGLPDNELTRQLPELPFTITSFEFYDLESPMVVYFTDASYEGMKAYVALLEESGFTEDAGYLPDDEANGWIAWNGYKDGRFGIAFGSQGENGGTLTINMF